MAETWRVVPASGEVLGRYCRGYARRRDARGDRAELRAVALACSRRSRPGELTCAEIRGRRGSCVAPMARVVDVLAAAAVVQRGNPAADRDPDAQLCAVRAAVWSAGAEAMRAERSRCAIASRTTTARIPCVAVGLAQVGAGDRRVNIEKPRLPVGVPRHGEVSR